MIAARRDCGGGAVMARPPLVVSALPLRRDTAPHCEAGLPPDIRAVLLVGGMEGNIATRKGTNHESHPRERADRHQRARLRGGTRPHAELLRGGGEGRR